MGVASVTVLALLLGACGGDSGDDASTSPSTPASSDSATATPSETPSATPTVEPTTLGDLSTIEVSQDMSVEPTITAPYPFVVDQTMTKVIVEGSGRTVPDTSATVQVQYVGINARTGATFDSSWSSGSPVAFQLTQLISGFGSGVVNHTVGSRLAIAITSDDGYGDSGYSTIGIEAGDTLLFIVDILDTELSGPSGETVTPPDGLPLVSEENGVPKITIPEGLAEPTAVQVQPLIQGSGRELGSSDALTSHAVCTTWDGNEYYNDYGEAAVSDASSGSVHQALFNALVGQKTGSRVLVTMPGSVAYPNGNRTPSLAANTSVACVVDILFTSTYS
ncbi:hypothetical protein GCM10009785_02670 [Brooklawnia cerclae]